MLWENVSSGTEIQTGGSDSAAQNRRSYNEREGLSTTGAGVWRWGEGKKKECPHLVCLRRHLCIKGKEAGFFQSVIQKRKGGVDFRSTPEMTANSSRLNGG